MSRPLRPATLQTGLHVENLVLCLQAARQHALQAGCPATLRKVLSAIKSAEGARRHLARRLDAAAEKPDRSEEPRFRNFYRCDRCGHEWEDVWSATSDDDCRACGARHMSPYHSEELDIAPEQSPGPGLPTSVALSQLEAVAEAFCDILALADAWASSGPEGYTPAEQKRRDRAERVLERLQRHIDTTRVAA